MTATATKNDEIVKPKDGPDALWKMADLIIPMAVRVAATLKIADLIAAGYADVGELANKIGADKDALARLLRYLAVRGIFVESSAGKFEVNELAAFLRDDHPNGIRRMVDLEGFGRIDLAFFELLSTVRTGRPAEAGRKEISATQAEDSFDHAMEAQSRAQAPALVASCDWAGVKHVVDVGGGTGTLLLEVIKSRPDIRGTLIELPATASRARKIFDETGLSGRAEIVSGSFFETMPRDGDVYLLKFVLHGLTDADSIKLLANCRSSMANGGRVVLIERSAGSGEDLSRFTAMDLRMMVLNGGRERTIEQYAAIAKQAGLQISKAIPTSIGLHLIELIQSAQATHSRSKR